MDHQEISELFILAAETDRRLPNTARPAILKAQALPYFHDEKDVQGWGGERFEQERQEFWDKRSTRLSVEEVSEWERANVLIVYVSRERDRRCLWSWSMSKAGGMPFRKWCRDIEHISRTYATDCKNRAIDQIYECLSLNASIDVINCENGTVPNTPEIGHILDNIDEPRTFAWMAPGAFVSQVNLEAQDFTWSEKQNERRRQKIAMKKAEEAKRQEKAE